MKCKVRTSSFLDIGLQCPDGCHTFECENICKRTSKTEHCVKSVQIRSFFFVRIFPYLDWIWTRTKLRIWILFTQWRLGCIWQRRWCSTAFYFWNKKLRDNFKDKSLKLYLICSHKWILDMIFYRYEWQFTDQDK